MNSDVLNLLIFTDSDMDIDTITSAVFSRTQSMQFSRVNDMEQLFDHLQTRTHDLLLIAINAAEELDSINHFKKKNNINIPIMVIDTWTESNLIEIQKRRQHAMTHGAVDIIDLGTPELLADIIFQAWQQRNQNQLRAYHSEQLASDSRDAVAILDQRRHIYANPSYLEFLGLPNNHDIQQLELTQLIIPEQRDQFRNFLDTYSPASIACQQEIKIRTHYGKDQSATLEFSPYQYQQRDCIKLIITREQIASGQQKQLEKIRYQCPTTGLYNHEYLEQKLEDAIDQAVIQHQDSALIYIQFYGITRLRTLVGQPPINDLFQQIHQKLQAQHLLNSQFFQPFDDVIACCHTEKDSNQLIEFSQQLMTAIKRILIQLPTISNILKISTGISLISSRSDSPQQIIREAACASFFEEKELAEPAPKIKLFDSKADSSNKGDEKIEQRLYQVLKENRFTLAFQPLVNLRGDERPYYEALIRLPQKDGENISAGEILNSKRISQTLKNKIDRWVILRSIQLLAKHHQQQNKHTRVFINLSDAALIDGNLPNWIAMALKTAGLPVDCMIYQFSEENARQYLPQTKQFSEALKKLGLPCAISRFGCSPQSQQTLQALPVNFVKLDGSFTRQMENDRASDAQLGELLTEINDSNRISIVPLIENAALVSRVWHLGGHFIQGYYVQSPQQEMSYRFSTDINNS